MSYSSFASVYDDLMKRADYSARAKYIQKILKDYGLTCGLLLDLACGTGTLSIELSRLGFEVIGTDASPEMLSVAQNKSYEADEPVMFVCQKMEETDLYGTVRAAVCTLDSLNHLDNVDSLNKTFKRLRNFIDSDGIMVFDVNTLYKHREVLGNNTFVYDEKNVFCVWQNSLLPDNKTVSINLDFFKKDGNEYVRFNESFKETAFTDAEITAVVENAGFRVVKKYGENTFEKPTADCERVYYVIGGKING